MQEILPWWGTTVLTVRRAKHVVMISDGQVSLGKTVMKARARKVRRAHHGRVVVGFAGATADAFTLFETFEMRLSEYSGNLTRAAVELAKEWRTNRTLRHLEALLMAADTERSLIVSGSGDVIEPEGGAMAIGSGGMYALAAAQGLLAHSTLPLQHLAEEAMRIAAGIDVYTNDQFCIEELPQRAENTGENAQKTPPLPAEVGPRGESVAEAPTNPVPPTPTDLGSDA